jgi:hypothetical protein
VGAAARARARAGVCRLALLDVQAATRFELDGRGRILREGPPDLGPAPRLWLAGSAEGSVLRLRANVPDEVADAAAALVAREPLEGCVPELAALLGGEPERGLSFVFRDVPPEPGGEIVLSGTPAGDELLARGLPPAFAELGFRDEDELWPPWCVALDGGEPAAIAFSARLSAAGVEAGVFTAPAARGRGLAAAATAGWAASPALGDRVRFYSTTAGNVSSQRVAERLGLDLVGPAYEIR